MRPFTEASISLQPCPMMTLNRFMSAYRIFCKKYGYADQAGLVLLSQIEDELILASVDGSSTRHARLLYLQAFHLRENAKEMTPTSLTQAAVYFDRHSARLLNTPARELQLA